MKWLSLILILSAFNAYAQEAVCPQKEIEVFDDLEHKLKVCTVVDYGEDEWRTSEMLKAYNRSIECMQKVAYELFDKYYKNSNKTTKEHFDDYVNAVIGVSNDITFGSDWGVNIRGGEVYSLQAAGYAHFMIKSIIGEYIKEIREECAEAYQFEQEFAYEKNF